MSKNIPSPGLGTWQNKDPEKCAEAVRTALDLGYRHVDTAQVYENEEYVGRGIEKSEKDRDDLFLATKVWIDQLAEEGVISSTKESLEKLGTDHVDILYVHWPAGDYHPEETLGAFERLVEEGRTEMIGVSNFTVSQMEKAQEVVSHGIAANQVEMHPLLQQEEVLEYCQENDITLVAYSPLARGEVFEVPEIQEIAEKHGVSEAQVSLAWLMSKDNVVPIPKSENPDHIESNLEAKDLELDREDIEKIDSIQREERKVDPGFAPEWD
ncbi:MAG: aldo/keto reductase [Candidatus Nanohaloarchaea archaeon]